MGVGSKHPTQPLCVIAGETEAQGGEGGGSSTTQFVSEEPGLELRTPALLPSRLLTDSLSLLVFQISLGTRNRRLIGERSDLSRPSWLPSG